MSAIGAIGSYGSIGGYYSIYQNKNGFQNRNANPTSMEPVGPVSRTQTTPVPPVDRVSTVHRGASQAVPQEESQFPTMREGADPAEMAVRARIKYVGDEELQNSINPPQENAGGLKAGQTVNDSKSPQEVVEESECQTCKNRKYQDGSNDPGVSFKTPTAISPERAAFAIRSHEAEHVAHARLKALEEDKEIVSQSVSYRTGICPECGKTFMAGGNTRTVLRTAPETYQQEPVKKGVYLDLTA